MKAAFMQAAVAALILTPCLLVAQAPAGAPAGTTGKCKDGSYTSQATKQGACRGHKGIDTWYAAADAAPKAAATASSAAPASTSKAAAPASSGPMPAGATGKCKDGSYTTAPKKQGACRGHQGVDTWFAADAAPTPAAAKSTATPNPAATPAPSQASTPSPAAAAPQKSSSRMPASAKTAAPGGGPGLVWVNSSTNVYHCYGTQFYGTTKSGKYMSESDAKAAGARPDRNKPCSAK